MIEVKILYEDAQLIVCVKPPGMPSQAERSSTMDLASWLKNYLALKQGDGAGEKVRISVWYTDWTGPWAESWFMRKLRKRQPG